MAQAAQWRDFERWLDRTNPRARAFKVWIPLLRDGKVDISLRLISYDETAGAISQEVSVSIECPLCVVEIGKFHDSYRKDKRTAIKFALERLGVHPSRARALEEAKLNNGQSFLYDQRGHNYGSLLLALVLYTQQCETPALPSAREDVQESNDVPQKLTEEELYKPPSPEQQLERYAAMHPTLMKYLRQKGVCEYANTQHWKAIRDWTQTTDGVAAIRSGGLDPLGFHLDHIIPEQLGGVSCVFNCVFMPSSANSHFGKYYTKEKCKYMGVAVCTHAESFAKWHTGRVSLSLSGYNSTGVYVLGRK